tara:strand:- start:20 stop:781 length:762 start_codon:yes stop_codon:yes gene_type:complete
MKNKLIIIKKLPYLFLIVMLSFSCQQKRIVNPEIEKLFSNSLEDYVEPLLKGFSSKMFRTSIGDSLFIERILYSNKVNRKPTIYNSNFRKITLYRSDTIITIDFWKSIDSYSLKTRTTLVNDSILKLEMYMFQDFSEISSNLFNKMKKKWKEDIINENNKLNKIKESYVIKSYDLKDGYATLQLSESIYSSGFPRAHIRSDGTGFFYYSNNKTQNCKTNLTWTKRGNNAEINIGTNPNCPGVASKFNGSYPIE